MKDDDKTWIDKPRNVTIIFYSLVGICAFLFLSDLYYHKHPHLDFEGWFGFHAIYGFFGSVFLVLAAKSLRKLLMRDEDYYDD